MLTLLLKGFIIGLAIAAPVGPIGLLCIQRSLQDGFKIGLMTGLGAAAADGVYGCIVAFGLTALSSFLISQLFWVRSIGAILLISLGIQLWRKPIHPNVEKSQTEADPWHAFFTTLLLTLTNPATILSFIAIFAGLGAVTQASNYLESIFLVTAIILGSMCWWLILSASTAFVVHHRISTKTLGHINRASAIILFGFGITAIFF